MKAIVNGTVIAESDDIVESNGYHYFRPSNVRTECLVKAPKTDADLACPHGVQFYDVLINGMRYERSAWSYEAPRPALKHIGGRFGFWNDVEVG